MTLIELMIAMTIMVMVVGAMGFLAKGVEQGFGYIENHGTVTQHARIAMQRITRTVREATANEQFPGIHVVSKDVASWQFPDTLVVWKLDTNADGLPQFDEMVIFCPDLSDPEKLVEISIGENSIDAEEVDDDTSWDVKIGAIKKSSDWDTVVLTDRMRTCSVEGVGEPQRRGAIRFDLRLSPSEDEWDSYSDPDHPDYPTPWSDLPWVQGIFTPQTGLRQAWVRIELQLLPDKQNDPTGQRAIPFLGSAALYFNCDQPQP